MILTKAEVYLLKREKMALEKKWIFGQLPEHGQKRLKEINLLLECSQIAEPTNNGQLEIGNLVVMSNQLHYADTDERSDSQDKRMRNYAFFMLIYM